MRKALITLGLKPEFVNRIDEVVEFRSLDENDLKAIANHLLKRFQSRLKNRDIEITWEEDVLSYLAREGYREQFGARELRRVIEQQVENVIAGMIVRDEAQIDDNIEGNALKMIDLRDTNPPELD